MDDGEGMDRAILREKGTPGVPFFGGVIYSYEKQSSIRCISAGWIYEILASFLPNFAFVMNFWVKSVEQLTRQR